jgi:UDP-N-acetylmuramate dehydrogenase
MTDDLAPLTTLRVGGPAARLVSATTRDELVTAALDAWGTAEDWLVLGGGSNVVIADEGFDGTVVRVETRGIERLADATGPHPVRLRVEAGEPWDDVVAYAVEHGLGGIEALSGIPGSTGAAPIQNIGAYGEQLSETLVAIDFLDAESGEVSRLDASELELGYRTSSLKLGRRGVVLGIELGFPQPEGLSAPVSYDQLAVALGVAVGDRVPLADARAAVLALRASKGMVLDPGDADSVSAGSFFTNPIVSESFARGLPVDAPRWPLEPEQEPRVLPLGAEIPAGPASGSYLVKLSAAWLIERAGIGRGFGLPGSGAGISSKHTLAIVNRGGATAADIAELARYIQTRVLSEFGVQLQPEPVLVGVEL